MLNKTQKGLLKALEKSGKSTPNKGSDNCFLIIQELAQEQE